MKLSHRRIRALRVRNLVPNMFTIMALCAGLTGIRYAIDGQFQLAVGLVVLAGVLDGLDGRSARLFKTTSELGKQLDSLADCLSFGVAPAVMVYLWSLHELRAVGWALALMFAACSALRLARFNIESDAPDRPAWKAFFFTGMPAPAAAGSVLVPMMASFGLDVAFLQSFWLNAALVAFVACMMVSRVPTLSLKRIRLDPDYVLPVLLTAGVLVAFLAAEFWLTLAAIGLIYLASLPFVAYSARHMRRRERHHDGTGAKHLESQAAPTDQPSTTDQTPTSDQDGEQTQGSGDRVLPLERHR